MVKAGKKAVGGGGGVVVQGQHFVHQAVGSGLGFSRGELDTEHVFGEMHEKAGDGSDPFSESP